MTLLLFVLLSLALVLGLIYILARSVMTRSLAVAYTVLFGAVLTLTALLPLLTAPSPQDMLPRWAGVVLTVHVLLGAGLLAFVRWSRL